MPTRAERRREERAKRAAEAQINVSPYPMSRRFRRHLRQTLIKLKPDEKGLLKQ